MFSDKSRFILTSNSGWDLLRRERRTRYTQQYVRERVLYGPGILVWAGILLYGAIQLHIFERGSVISQRYCREIILDHVRPFWGAVDLYTSCLWTTMSGHT